LAGKTRKLPIEEESEFKDMPGKFMGYNPILREMGYVPNFPDRVARIQVFTLIVDAT